MTSPSGEKYNRMLKMVNYHSSVNSNFLPLTPQKLFTTQSDTFNYGQYVFNQNLWSLILLIYLILTRVRIGHLFILSYLCDILSFGILLCFVVVYFPGSVLFMEFLHLTFTRLLLLLFTHEFPQIYRTFHVYP